MKTDCFRIGELARATDTKVVTIRYYEKIGLLPEPPRGDGNYRSYDGDSLNRLRFIRRCRQLGFSLDQVRELMELQAESSRSCAGVDEITAAHLGEIQRKIADLKSLETELRRIAQSCGGGGTIADCRIIEAISPAAEQPLNSA